MKTEEFKDLIRPIVYKYGSGWLLDAPEMLEEICKKYHKQQLLIHSVSKSFYCGVEERKEDSKCEIQCAGCEYKEIKQKQ